MSRSLQERLKKENGLNPETERDMGTVRDLRSDPGNLLGFTVTSIPGEEVCILCFSPSE